MNREQWYINYQAARILVQSRRYHYGEVFAINFNEPARKVVWDIAYKAIRELGGEHLLEAVFHADGYIYDICRPSNRWAVKHNTKTFNRKMPIRESKKKWFDMV